MEIQDQAAPQSTLLGRKFIIGLLLVWWAVAQFTTHWLIPTLEPYMAAMADDSPHIPTP